MSTVFASPPRPRTARRAAGVALGLAWAAAVAAGLALLHRYETTPGPRGPAPARWPADSPLRRAPGRHTLVLALHPRCPCSRATVHELAEVMARAGGRLDVYALFYHPAADGPAWADGALRRQAAAVPGVTVRDDADGAEGRRFGAATSGHAALYGPDGRLLFAGGLTRSRGGEGESAGRAAVVAFVTGAPAPAGATPVFGCPLCESGPAPAPEEPCTPSP